MIVLTDGMRPHTDDYDFILASSKDLHGSWSQRDIVTYRHLPQRLIFQIEDKAITQEIPYAVIASEHYNLVRANRANARQDAFTEDRGVY